MDVVSFNFNENEDIKKMECIACFNFFVILHLKKNSRPANGVAF